MSDSFNEKFNSMKTNEQFQAELEAYNQDKQRDEQDYEQSK